MILGMDFQSYSLLFKATYFILLVPTVLVIISAFLSAQQMGGTIGYALKKIAAGTIIDSILVLTYSFLEKGLRGILDENQVRLFFLMSGLFASLLLISGYVQLYKISKKLKLFTV